MPISREVRPNTPADAIATAPPASDITATQVSAAPDLATEIVRLAATDALDVGKLAALIDMQKDIRRSAAEAAFDSAFVDLQADLPNIARTSQADGGKWAYASLDAIVEQVRPILYRHGFSISHMTAQPTNTAIHVTGILSHRLGHKRMSVFVAEPDTTGSKNKIQAIGSAIAYGRKYSTLDLLGLATSDTDDDGVAAGGRPHAGPVADPPGFAEWYRSLEVVADGGAEGLRAFWFKTNIQYRKHLTDHHAARWEGLKRHAAQVKP